MMIAGSEILGQIERLRNERKDNQHIIANLVHHYKVRGVDIRIMIDVFESWSKKKGKGKRDKRRKEDYDQINTTETTGTAGLH